MLALSWSVALVACFASPAVDEVVGEEPAVDAPVESEPEAPASEPTVEAEPEPIPTPEQVVDANAAKQLSEGGFGEIGTTHVESNVQAPPPPEPATGAQDDAKPEVELGARVEIGYAQTNLANAAGLDHAGVLLRAHLMVFPWIARSRVAAGGIGLAYTYTGVNRGQLPDDMDIDIETSSAEQQDLTFSFELLLRPQRDWLSIQLTPMAGLGWYANAQEIYAADRSARISPRDYALAAGGVLALCTAWETVCVSGGARMFFVIDTLAPSDDVTFPPWGWHAALGVDVMRVLARLERVPR